MESKHKLSSEEKSNFIGTPTSEIEIDEVLVYRLLEEQHPDLKEFPLHLIDQGWHNVMFRLGEQLCVRLPRNLFLMSVMFPVICIVSMVKGSFLPLFIRFFIRSLENL